MNRRELFIYSSINVINAMILSSCNQKELKKLNLSVPNDLFVQINLYGGPNRFVFDHLINHKNDKDFLPTSFLGTVYNPQTKNLDYKLVKHKDLMVPPLWKMNVTTNKGEKEISQLFENSMMIRGVLPKFHGHPNCAIQTVRPQGSKNSLHGHLTTDSNFIFPAVLFGSNPMNQVYNSDSLQPIELEVTTNLKDIFNKLFTSLKLGKRSESIDRKELLKETINLFKKTTNDREISKKLEVVAQSFFEDVDELRSDLEQTYNKYRSNSRKSISKNIVKNINDIDTSNLKLQNNEDISTLRLNFNSFFQGNNIKELVEDNNIDHFAIQFAITELLIKRGISNNFMISSKNEMGNYFQKINKKNIIYGDLVDGKFTSSKESDLKGVPMDTHNTGLLVELACSSSFFIGLSSCMFDLIDAVQEIKTNKKSLFENSLFQITSEFSRMPNQDGSGSEHNEFGQHTTLICGRFKGPQIMGNILLKKEKEGTIGTAAKMSTLPRIIEPKDIMQTITDFFKLKTTVPRAFSLINWDEEVPKFTYHEARIIK